jgi:signal transduction histidine kinase
MSHRLPRLGLRARVALLCAALGLVVSACLALVAEHFSDSYVHRLIDEMLRVEADYLRDRYVDEGVLPNPRSKHFHAFASDAGAPHAPPAAFAELEPGLHEIEDPRDERHVAVYDLGGRRFYVVLDIGLESKRERRLARELILLALFGGALSAWLGWFLAGRAIEPVRRLAQHVESLGPPVAGGAAAPLAPDFAADEVGALAGAFDRYQARLQEYVRRERAFTADASHELRTPLAVIRGAIEVMLDNAGLDAAMLARLKRVQRGADELRDLLDALLVLARGDDREPGDGRIVEVDLLIADLLRERRDAFAEKGLHVDCQCAPSIAVAAPRSVLAVVIGNLLRAITQFADGGVLRVRLDTKQLLVAHAGDGASAGTQAPQFAGETRDPMLGLGMIRRVCERRGWSLEESVESGSHAFVLRFARR